MEIALDCGLSGGCIPIKLNVSVSKVCLIFVSSGDVELNDGQTLTSSSHGFNVLSINTSKPYNSKQLFRCSAVLQKISSIFGSVAIQVLMMTSSMFLNSVSTS